MFIYVHMFVIYYLRAGSTVLVRFRSGPTNSVITPASGNCYRTCTGKRSLCSIQLGTLQFGYLRAPGRIDSASILYFVDTYVRVLFLQVLVRLLVLHFAFLRRFSFAVHSRATVRLHLHTRNGYYSDSEGNHNYLK
uniref:Secreted protein n=1 Tax=Angiostrongylus cantonensis TaxID=6313 RepID=A0A0K0DF64_ANGCA